VAIEADITRNKWTHSWVFYHILFWASIAFSLAYDIIEYLPYDPIGYFLSVTIRMALSAGLLYGNLYFLIPSVFNKSKLLYWMLLILMTALFILFYKTTYFITTQMVSEVPMDTWPKIINRLIVAIRFLLFSLFLKFIQDWFYQEKKINDITTTQLATELHYLRSQINPHFLFNTLNNIYSLTLKKSEKAPEVVLRLSEMMEYMIYESDGVKVPLDKEIKNLSNYLEIERIRQGNEAAINFEVIGEFKSKQVAPLLFLPLLENAVKHGINKSIANAFLKARLGVTDQQITFIVENNNSERPGTAKRDGIGIQNLKKRLELFYKDSYRLKIEEGKDRYKVELTIVIS
jgi:sensor histidine kinase YesM